LQEDFAWIVYEYSHRPDNVHAITERFAYLADAANRITAPPSP